MNARTIQTPAREPDIPEIDLASFTLRHGKQLGDKPALIDGASGRALSYAELVRAVHCFAAGLAARGFGKGDTFCICMPNVPEFAVAFHGVLAAGGRCTTANPMYTARELGHQLADTNARILLTVPRPSRSPARRRHLPDANSMSSARGTGRPRSPRYSAILRPRPTLRSIRLPTLPRSCTRAARPDYRRAFC
jgi:acyl-CoA synthetase (AMP-forming)/AMP-acid ligase II